MFQQDTELVMCACSRYRFLVIKNTHTHTKPTTFGTCYFSLTVKEDVFT